MKHDQNFFFPHQFGGYVSPKKAYEMDVEVNGEAANSVAWYRAAAKKVDEECYNCGRPVWRMVNLGMCFSCVTGESDAGDDFELEPAL